LAMHISSPCTFSSLHDGPRHFLQLERLKVWSLRLPDTMPVTRVPQKPPLRACAAPHRAHLARPPLLIGPLQQGGMMPGGIRRSARPVASYFAALLLALGNALAAALFLAAPGGERMQENPQACREPLTWRPDCMLPTIISCNAANRLHYRTILRQIAFCSRGNRPYPVPKRQVFPWDLCVYAGLRVHRWRRKGRIFFLSGASNNLHKPHLHAHAYSACVKSIALYIVKGFALYSLSFARLPGPATRTFFRLALISLSPPGPQHSVHVAEGYVREYRRQR
jgi:hypothetical protein